MIRRALPLLLAGAALLALGLGVEAKDEATLPVLRRKLLEAHDAEAIREALHALTQRIGAPGFPADHGAFADWLGTVPDGRAEHPLVKRHRGWALVRAKRGDEAVPHLEVALKDDPSDGLTRAWLADALRQAGRFDEATDMLVAAVECGQKDKYVDETIVAIVLGFRKDKISGHADDLPGYVLAARRYLAVRADPKIQQLVARLLLDDFATFEKPERTRGKSWARAAAAHALTGIVSAKQPVGGELQLAYDAARALEHLDEATNGKTLRFDLLAEAYRRGRDPNGGPNANPDVVVWLAEGAARDGRYALAFRLATERLEISESPRASRLLRSLPPDLGGEA